MCDCEKQSQWSFVIYQGPSIFTCVEGKSLAAPCGSGSME